MTTFVMPKLFHYLPFIITHFLKGISLLVCVGLAFVYNRSRSLPVYVAYSELSM